MRSALGKFLLCLLLWVAAGAQAYIPPVRGIVNEVLQRRQPQGVLEVRMKHRVQVEGGQTLNLEETLVQDKGRTLVVWSIAGLPKGVGAEYSNQFYRLNGSKAYSSRSGVFLKYLTTADAEAFLRQLLTEQFLRSDQLSQFKSGYQPTGDPKTWKTSEYYAKHPDIRLHRLPEGIAIAVIGTNESSLRKAVYFDQDLQGLLRAEWKEGDTITAWTFNKFGKAQVPGRYPKEMSFIFNGVQRVVTELVSVRALQGQEFGKFRDAFTKSDRSGNFPPTVDAALKLLLSYR